MARSLFKKCGSLMSLYHFLLAFLGAVYYRFPSSRMEVFGVTGTNGKTTTVELTARILKEAGYRVAVFSSNRFEIAGEEERNMYKMTMPGRAVLQGMLRKAANKGCQVAIMEVTSEGMRQHRHRFIRFSAACFTNLSPEHIESHGGFENYKRMKGELFKATKDTHIINIDDEHADYFLGFPARRKVVYGVKGEHQGDDLLRATDISSSPRGTEFVCRGKRMYLPLKGAFNVYNALAATSFASLKGVDMDTVAYALSGADVIPGRMEEVISSPFRVIVDYAVTPVTLEGVYEEIRENFSPRRMIGVLGSCGGGRDKWKRPVLGEIAARYCDEVILTNEDPYDENPREIIDDIASGISGEFHSVLDRRDAIREALRLAKEGDVVVVTGKGCEPWMCLGRGKKIAWDDREIIKEEYANRRS